MLKYLKNSYWVGTSEKGLYQVKLLDNGEFTSRHFTDLKIGLSKIQSIKEDKNKNLWISSYEGLHKLTYDNGYNSSSNFGEENGISNFVKVSLVDFEGNIWIGTYGDGLAMLKDEIFTFYKHSENESIPNDTRCFLATEGVKWYGLSEGLLKVNLDGEKKYFNSTIGFENVADHSKQPVRDPYLVIRKIKF